MLTKGREMDNMGWLVLGVQFARLFCIAVVYELAVATLSDEYSPQISLRRRREDPLLAWLLSKARTLWLVVDAPFDTLANEPATSGNENDICFGSRGHDGG